MESWVVGIILTISTIVSVAGSTGLLPSRIRRWVALNKADETLDVLRELGIDVDGVKRANAARAIPKTSLSGDLPTRAEEALSSLTTVKDVQVGSVNQVFSKAYVDLMGASTAPGVAGSFASMLAQHWRGLVVSGAKEATFDFVVTPKNGSPILGYKFAKLVNRPLALHNEKPKFRGSGSDPTAIFDFRQRPPEGARALVVDDSTTGGDKVLRAVRDLREHGFKVSDCLVVFEPKVKNARARLDAENVALHSIVELPALPA